MTDHLNPNNQPELSDQDAELLSAYLDGMLTDDERRALEQRLADEAYLRSELQAMRQTVAMINALPTLKAPRNFTITAADVADTSPQAPSDAKVVPLRRNYLWYLAPAAALIIVAVGIIALLSSPTRELSGAAGSSDSVALQMTVPAADSAELDLSADDTVPETSPQSMAQSAISEPTNEAAFSMRSLATSTQLAPPIAENNTAMENDALEQEQEATGDLDETTQQTADDGAGNFVVSTPTVVPTQSVVISATVTIAPIQTMSDAPAQAEVAGVALMSPAQPLVLRYLIATRIYVERLRP